MKKENNNILFIFLRYLFVLIIALPKLDLFYFIFTPLTIYPVYFLLNLFYNALLVDNFIFINNVSISLIPACIAGSAYFLLVLLNFSVSMNWKKRIFSLVFSLVSFLIINISRIFIFSILLINNFQYFDITHKIFWLLLSGIIVFMVWILTIKIFKIREIPFYSDIQFVYLLTKIKKR